MLKDFIIEVMLPFIFISVLIVGGISTATNYHEKYKCDAYQETTGRNTKWVFFDDCYVDSGNGWLTKHEYSATIIAREGLKDQ